MIEARQLSKRFGAKLAVDGVSFRVEAGSIVGFLGPNGAGKSTTLRLLTGYLQADSGSAEVAGYDVATRTAAARARLGYLPEAAAGFGNLTVREFLIFCAEARGLRGQAGAQAVDAVAGDTALRPALDLKIRTLSKGWRQRAWFAQALLHDPPVLILDEPTDGLDPNQKAHVRDYMRGIAAQKAVIFSTHILEEAEEVCDRVIVIDRGRILADAPTAELADGKGRLAPAFRDLTAGRPEQLTA